MKDIKTVEEMLYKYFLLFYTGEIGNDTFVQMIKTLCKGKGNKSYWFRFFINDTGANDWQSISSSLQSPKNTQYLKECIEIALQEKQVKVYYS